MNPKPPLVRRSFRILAVGIALSMLGLYVYSSQRFGKRRIASSSKSTRILEDLRLIDAAIDQYAIESNKEAGTAGSWHSSEQHLKKGARPDEERLNGAPVNQPGEQLEIPVATPEPILKDARPVEIPRP